MIRGGGERRAFQQGDTGSNRTGERRVLEAMGAQGSVLPEAGAWVILGCPLSTLSASASPGASDCSRECP